MRNLPHLPRTEIVNYNLTHQLINALSSHPPPPSCIFGYSISPAFLSTSIPCHFLLQKQFWRSTYAFCPIAKMVLKSFSPWPDLQDLVWILRFVPLPPQALLTPLLHPLGAVNVALTLTELPGCIARGVPVLQLCPHFVFTYCHFCLFNKTSFFNSWQHNVSLGVLWLGKSAS